MAADVQIEFKSVCEINNRSYLLTLSKYQLCWEPVSYFAESGKYSLDTSGRTKHEVVPLQEILTVYTKESSPNHSLQNINSNAGSLSSRAVELSSFCHTALRVHFVKREKRHRWKERGVTFEFQNEGSCQEWVERIESCLTEFNRPKKLLIFINPFGGKRKARKIYHEKVAPLFELARIQTEVIETKRKDHAYDWLLEEDLTPYDGIVCVGGDGMFAELLNGLLRRTMSDAGVAEVTTATTMVQPKLRIGMIPAGSTDAVVYTTTGANDPVTSALHIIIGDDIAIDVSSVFHNNQLLKYYVTMLAYGFYGDVLVDSEEHRWMGPKRYDWSGFKKFVKNRTYEGEISYLECCDEEHHPQDGNRCYNGCKVCDVAGDQRNTPAIDLTWKTFRGRFISFQTVTMPCRCGLSPHGVSPYQHLGNGCTDLIIVRDCSRFDYLRHMVKILDRTSDQFDFNFVQVHRVKAFKFRAITETEDDSETSSGHGRQRLRSRRQHTSVWNCDGEILEKSELDVSVHCQLIRLFARNIEDESLWKESCPSSCISCSARR